MANKSYNESSIKVLKGLDGVRKRPAMYIGDTGVDGFHHLVQEALDNSVDEAVAGFCKKIRLEFHDDHVVVIDDGRGIPVKNHPTENIPTVDVVMTMLHAGGKFGGADSMYKVSGGLHGVGISVVNALSDWLEVEVKRQGKIWHRRYEDGEPTEPKLKKLGTTKETGTKVSFMPKKNIFKRCEFDKNRIVRRLRELAFLNAGLEIELAWKDHEVLTFKSEKGLVEYVEYLVDGREKIHEPIRLSDKNVDGCSIDLAFVYDDKFESNIHSYTNNINTIEGGVHLNATLDSMCKVITDIATANKLLKGLDIEPNKSDIMEGLSLIVSVMIPEPQFGGQTKTRLTNSELRGPFGRWAAKAIEKALLKDKSIAKEIASKIVDAIKARDAARKAKNLSRKKSLTESLTLPGKLADCSSKDPSLSEVFIVEGDSAGGTAIMARDREFQAILPLRGKVLNVSKTTLNKTLDNKELGALISALGVSVTAKEVLLDDLRYHKVIICTDADPDGGHICCLLMAFFYKFMRRLIEGGHLYVCDLPLYRVVSQGKSKYLKDDAALQDFRNQNNGKKIDVSRFKGLGEMDVDELSETAMNLGTRSLKRVHIADEIFTKGMLERLMGSDIQGRKEFLADALNFEEV